MASKSSGSAITIAQLRAVLALDKGAFTADLATANSALQKFNSQASSVANSVKTSVTQAFKQTATQSTESLNAMAVSMTRQVETIQRSLQKLSTTRTNVSVTMDTAKLNEQITAVREQLNTLLTRPQTIDVVAQTAEAKEKIAALQTQLAALKNQAGIAQIKVDTGPAVSSVSNLKTTMASLADGAGVVAGRIATSLKNGFSSAFSGIGNLVSGAKAQFDQLLQKAQQTGIIMSALFTAPLLKLGKDALSLASDYQTSMNVLQAVSGATAEQMTALNNKAIALGADLSLPATSAKDAADAMLELSKAGLSVNNVMGAAKGTMQLSAAANIDAAKAAEITANALLMFRLRGEDASKVADMLAASANQSSAEIGDMADALTQGGALFAQMKIPLDQFLTSVAMLSNLGLKGSQAGTSLRYMLLNLEAPTSKAAAAMKDLGIQVFNAHGALLPWPTIMEQLRTKLNGMSQAQQAATEKVIFGRYAIMAAGDTASSTVEDYNRLNEAINKSGAAGTVASARMAGLGGAVEGLKSQVETLVLQETQPFMGMLEGWVRSISEFIPRLSEIPQGLKNLALGFAVALAATGPLLLIISGLAAGIGALLSPIGLVVAGFIALGTAVANNLGGVRDIVLPIVGKLVQFFASQIPTALNIFGSVWNGILVPAFQTFSTIVTQYALPALASIGDWVGTHLPPVIQAFGILWQSLQPVFLAIANVVFNWVIPALEKIGSFVVPIVVAGILYLAQVVQGFVSAWQTNWGGIRDIVAFVVNAITLNIQLVGGALAWLTGAFSGMSTSVKATLLDLAKFVLELLMPILFVFDLFANHAKEKGAEAGAGFTNNLSDSIKNGLPTINANIQGLADNLAALQGPAGTFGFDIGGNWIGSINNSVADGMQTLNGHITSIKNALASLQPGFIGPTKGFIGPLKPGESPQDALNQELAAWQQQYDQAQRDLNENLTHAAAKATAALSSNAGFNLPLFQGVGGGSDLGGLGGLGGGGGAGGSGSGSGAGSKTSALEAAVNMAKQWAEGVKAALSAISDTMKIQIPAGLSDKTDQLAQVLDMAVSKIQAVALRFGAKGLAAVTAFSDAAQKVFGAFSTAFDFFTKISETGNQVLNGATKIASLTDALSEKVVIIMNNLGPRVKNWSEDASAQVGAFADASGKVFSAFDIAFGFFTKISETGQQVLFGATKIASVTDALSEKVVIIMNNLGPRVALWTQDASEQVGAFADASGKVFTAFSTAFDFFTKISETGTKVLFGATAIAATTDALSEKVVIILNNLGPRVAWWTAQADTIVSGFADTAGKVFASFSTAYDFFTKLADTGEKVLYGAVRLAAATDALSEKVVIVMNNLGPRVALWTSQGDTIVSGFADATGKVFAAFSTVYDLFSKLADTGEKVLFGAAKLASLTDALSEKVVIILNNLGPRVALWTAQADTIVSGFADTAGKVFAAFSTAYTYFSGIATTGAKVLGNVTELTAITQTLAEKIVYILNNLGPAVALWTAQADGIVSGFADTAGKVFAALNTAYGFFAQLSETGAKVLANASQLAEWSRTLAEKIVYVLNNLGPAVSLWTAEADTLVSGFAETAGKVFGALGTAFTFFSGIAATGADVLSQVDVLQGLTISLQGAVVAVLNNLRPLVAAWDADALTLVGQFADASGKMLGALSTAFDLFAKLSGDGLKLPSASVIASLFSTLDSFLNGFVARSASWKDKATDDAAKIAANVGVISDAIGKAVDPLLKILDFKLPEGGTGSRIVATQGKDGSIVFGGAQSGMYAFFDALDQFITEFASRAQAWKDKAAPKVAAVATAIGTVMDGLGKAVDVVAKVGDTKDIDAGQIQGVFDKIGSMLDGAQALMSKLPEGWLEKAAAFATGLGNLFAGLKLATDSAAGIKNDDTLAAGLNAALTALQGIIDYMNTTAMGILDGFITKTISMRDTWTSAMDTMATSTEDMAKRVGAALGGIGGTGTGAGGGNQKTIIPPIGGGGGGGGRPLVPYSEHVPLGGYGSNAQHFHGDVLMINGDVVDANMPAGVKEYLVRMKPHKQIRNRGLRLANT